MVVSYAAAVVSVMECLGCKQLQDLAKELQSHFACL